MNYDNYNHTYRRNRISEPAQLIADRNIFATTVDQKHMLGCIFDLNNGSRFRYCRNGGVALTKAYMTMSSVQVDNWYDEPQTVASGAVVAAVGDKSITLLVQTAPTAHQWDEGYLVVANGTGEANMYIIKSHTLTTTPVVQIADAGGFRVATADATDISIVMNKYRDVLVAANNQTGPMTGVPLVDVAINYYFWAQTKGPCPMVNDDTDTPVIGDYCTQSDSAPGTAATPAAIADDIIYGTVMSAAATGETLLVDLDLVGG